MTSNFQMTFLKHQAIKLQNFILTTFHNLMLLVYSTQHLFHNITWGDYMPPWFQNGSQFYIVLHQTTNIRMVYEKINQCTQ